MARLTKLALVALCLAGFTFADTCSDVEEVAPSLEVAYTLYPAYTQISNEYWSTSCAALKPSCILLPSSARDVAAIIGVLNSNAETFAIKSGGHNANNYWSSIDGGPLISTENLDHVVLDEKTGVVQIGPGLRWDDVGKSLDGSGWSVVGGRIGNVGVGGYLLGGGLSFMSQQYGWAASSVIEFELVLANGTITTASTDHNPDLFKVLKGGGNNFGVVTSYTVQAYKQGDVYGGVLAFVHSEDTDAKLLKAIRDFTKYNDDDKAAIIPTAERTLGGATDIWVVFVYYNGPDPPTDVFKNFTDIGPVVNSCKRRSYAEFLSTNNWVVLKGSAYTIGTETVPLPEDDSVDVLAAVHEHWRNVTDSVLLVPGLVIDIAYQPFPRRMSQVAKEKGGDLYDLEDDVDLILIELSTAFLLQSDYHKIDVALQQSYNGIRKMVRAWQEDGTLEEELYLPLFANDAFFRQDYYARLKPENAELAKSLTEDLDPKGLFRDRTGGWKP